MKITTNSPQSRKILAVIDPEGYGIFLPTDGGGSAYVGGGTGRVEVFDRSIEEQANVKGRTPLYKGDSITIAF